MNIWQQYKEIFPRRYHAPGHFDSVVEETIKWLRPANALDVGGGQDGTQVLKASNVPTYILDPYVNKPPWMVEKVSWDCGKHFDLIVARGSINYLIPAKIKAIGQLLSPKGVFVANTFKEPPSTKWATRSYEKGMERFRLRGRFVEHELVAKDATLAHTFPYYSPKDWTTFLPGVKLIPYGNNSLLIHYGL